MPDWISALPPKLRPQYYVSDIPQVEEFKKSCSENFRWETGIWTSSLEYFYSQLEKMEGEGQALPIMRQCLITTLKRQIRYIPGRETNSRYLYRLLEAQVRGAKGIAGYEKRAT